MEGIVEFIIMEVILSGIGWICLHVWYRDRKKVEKIKNEKYAGMYGAAGRVMILNLIAGIGALATFALMIALLVGWIYDAITK
jgi:hypothetical protein